MGRLNEMVEEIYRLLDTHSIYIRMGLKYAARKNDIALLKKKASYATDSPICRPRPTKEDLVIRAAKPGKFNVVFVNKHTQTSQILTKKKGCYYDEALNFLNYTTDYQTESFNELGYYEIVKKINDAYLPEEEHFGI